MPLELFHPMVIHFPIVLLIQAAVIDVLVVIQGGSLSGPSVLAQVGRCSLATSAAAAVAAVCFGYLAQSIAIDKGFADALIERHEMLGVTTATTLVILAALRFGAPRFGIALEGSLGRLVAALTVAAFLLVVTTAYFGGDLVYAHGVNVALVKP